MISEYIVTNVCSDTTRALSRLLLTDVIYIDILDVYTWPELFIFVHLYKC